MVVRGSFGRRSTLDFRFNIVDCVGRLHLEGDGLAREGLDEDLHFGLGVRVSVGILCDVRDLRYSSGVL